MFALAALATLLPLVAAHGSLNYVVIDGTTITAPNPNGDSGQFPIRAINDINPVKGTSNPDMNCGHGAQPAALVADARPGSTIAFSWRNGEGGTWVHNTGPVMTYMASCGAAGCASFSGADAEFFKISELGRTGPDNHWAMADLTTGATATLSVTVPSDLPAGEYLVRHELIAMQLGMTQGGAEFYPACLQIRLAAPAGAPAPLPSGDLVAKFPGGYSDTDPGILDADIYNPGSTYTFPGPALFSSAVPDPSPADPSSPADPTTSDVNIPDSSVAATSTPGNTGCGNPDQKKKRQIIKRIVRQGPLIKKRSKDDKPIVKREAAPVQVPNAHRARADNVVRSRVMRGVF